MSASEHIYIEFTDGGDASGFETDLPSVLRMYIEDRLKEGKQIWNCPCSHRFAEPPPQS